MPGIYYKDGATDRTMTNVYYQDGGTTRTIVAAYYQDGANTRQVWPTGVQVNITDQSSDTAVISPSVALASYALNNTGSASLSGTPIAGQWLVSGAASDYDVRATVVSGAVNGSSDPTGTWLNLGTSRTWQRRQTALGFSSVSLLVEIRRVSDLVVVDSANITLTAEVFI